MFWYIFLNNLNFKKNLLSYLKSKNIHSINLFIYNLRPLHGSHIQYMYITFNRIQ